MTQTESQRTSAAPHLVRQIGLGSCVAIVVGSIIGSGIFKVPSEVATKLPGPLPMLAVWVVGGLFALSGALSFCEVAGAFPYSGGNYVLIREAYGRLPAFLMGWSNLLMLPASNGAVAIVFSQYALRLVGVLPGQPGFDKWTAISAVSATTAITAANVLGVKFGTGIQNLTTLAKTGGLVTLIALAAFIGLPNGGRHFVPAIPAGSFSLSTFGLALVSVMFACGGWMNIGYVSGEVLNPRKNLPKAVSFGVLIATSIYVLANAAYLTVFSVQDIGKSQTIAADSMYRLIGAGGATFIVVTVMLSTFGALNVGILTNPRIYFAMAEDGLFFRPLSHVHARYRTPHVAVILCGCLSVLYILIATAFRGSKAFNSLIDANVVGTLPFDALAVGSIFVFRRREKRRQAADESSDANLDDSLLDAVTPGHLETHPHPYAPPVRTPLFPLPPLMFVGSTILLVGNSLLNPNSFLPSLTVLGMLAAGAPLYYATIGRKAKQAT